MSETPTTFEEVIEKILRRIVREEIVSLKAEINGQDQLLDADSAAKLLAVSEDWLYRNAKRLPFTRKLGPKLLRFSSVGIQKYLSTRKST